MSRFGRKWPNAWYLERHYKGKWYTVCAVLAPEEVEYLFTMRNEAFRLRTRGK